MLHNLTDKQLESLRWLVQEVEAGNLNETFYFMITSTKQRPDALRLSAGDSQPNVPDYFGVGVLDALQNAGIVISAGKRVTLTRMAYELRDFDFKNPDPTPINQFLNKLYELIPENFTRSDLEQVWFEIEGGNTLDWAHWTNEKDGRLHFLLYMYRQKKLERLLDVFREKRPKEDWPDYPGAEEV